MWYKIIKEKMNELGISAYKLSKDCQIPYSTLIGNLAGDFEFSAKNLIKVTNYLKIAL